MNESIESKLSQCGIEVAPYRLSEKSMPVGVRFFEKKSEFVYRVEDDVLVFIIFRRDTVSQGLANAFGPVRWFLHWLKTHTHIKTVIALANPLPRAEGKPPLNKDRLRRFYQRYFNAKNHEYDMSHEWLKLELSQYNHNHEHCNHDASSLFVQ